MYAPKTLTPRGNPHKRGGKAVHYGASESATAPPICDGRGFKPYKVTRDKSAVTCARCRSMVELRENPAPRHESEIEAASKLQADFSGHEPGNIDTVSAPDNQVFTPVGKLAGVLYDTVRDGKREKYIHKFGRKSRPLLAASSDGTELRILGGGFRFTEAGIVDE